MINIYFQIFKFTNTISTYFYNKYCHALRAKQIKEKTRVV